MRIPGHGPTAYRCGSGLLIELYNKAIISAYFRSLSGCDWILTCIQQDQRQQGWRCFKERGNESAVEGFETVRICFCFDHGEDVWSKRRCGSTDGWHLLIADSPSHWLAGRILIKEYKHRLSRVSHPFSSVYILRVTQSMTGLQPATSLCAWSPPSLQNLLAISYACSIAVCT